MNATIHIRTSDEHIWKAITNKSEFIHKALNRLIENEVVEVIAPAPIKESLKAGFEAIETPDEDITAVQEVKPSFKLCKHGADPKFCRFAKPGKPCK